MAKKHAKFVASAPKNKKSIYKRWWFWLLIVALFFGGNKKNEVLPPETEPKYTESVIATDATPETVALVETTSVFTKETTSPAVSTAEALEDPEYQTTYILNTNSMKFHFASCGSADDIKDSNKSQFTGTREELLSRGYSPCGRCSP
jgi:hypothetical protein